MAFNDKPILCYDSLRKSKGDGSQMGHPELKKLEVDYGMFYLAFNRDVDFHDSSPQSTYLDLETGDTIWVFDEDEDASFNAGISSEENKETREEIEENPHRYLEIPGLYHGEHHAILREFLDSEWTQDEKARERARKAYFGSIGGWMDSVGDNDAIESYFLFLSSRTEELGEDFLRQNGIDPEWD